jgi:hypothetical protein
MKKYTVIRDTREKEKKGWIFYASANCLDTVDATLKTGDYTIHGYESLLTIERKGKIAEFAHNVCEARFEREMERLEAFKYAFVVLEFTMEDILDFPASSDIPKAKWPELKVSAFYLLRRLVELEMQYKTKFILAGRYGKETAASIFKRIIENE